MFVKNGIKKNNDPQNQKSLINRINLKKTEYVIKDDKIEVDTEGQRQDVQIKENPTRLREQISKLKSGQVYEVQCVGSNDKYLVHII